MANNKVVHGYVGGVAIAAVAVLAITSGLPKPDFDLWSLFSLLFVGCLMEMSRTHSSQKSGGLTGSLVFVFHLTVGLVIGAFWGAVIAGLVKAIAMVYERNVLVK